MRISTRVASPIALACLLGCLLSPTSTNWAEAPKSRAIALKSESVLEDPVGLEDRRASQQEKDVKKGDKEEGKKSVSKARGTITGKVKTRPKKYTKHALVYLKNVKGTFSASKKDPQTGKKKKKHPRMDQKNLIFVPHVLPVTKGATVDFLNSDRVLHNVFSPDNEKYNLGSWGKGQIKSYTFKKIGVYTQLCNVHPEMQAFVVVLQNPFWSKVDKKGLFKIRNVPPGKYRLVCWSERLKGAEKEVEVKAGEIVTVDFSLKGRK